MLNASHPSVAILGFDHNKDHLVDWADTLLASQSPLPIFFFVTFMIVIFVIFLNLLIGEWGGRALLSMDCRCCRAHVRVRDR